MKWITMILQIGLLTGIYMIGTFISDFFHLPVPGSIVGLVLLFILLQLKVVKLSWVELGGSFLLAELLLFFVPAVVGLVDYGEMMKTYGLKIIIVVSISTLIVMFITGVVAEYISKRKERSI
ncbi:CidA/LrgA family protein [Priestia endophytica]|uniref:CidA/LrgA family protein n=1 Tax=Priestia endophytica TaxID=135735 RepID=UPI002281EEA5|nr:CidA/LrgA family holin-like protein [Priestia endophytica]MCY8230789.1 CidA/LrgA family holin-like protein [Priestia endophytica]